MGKYRVLGSLLDRVYRNNLNANFDDVDADIQTQKKRVDDLIVANPQPSEVQDARGGFTVLRDRLNNTDAQLTERAIQKLSVQAMSADTKLKVGDIVRTVGFSNIFDKGGAFYEVIESIAVADGYSLIDLTGGLKAKIVITDKINARAFGATGNHSTIDDTEAIKRAITYAESLKDDATLDRFEKGITIFIPDGTYDVSSTIRITKSNISIKGESYSGTTLYAKDATFDVVVFDGSAKALYGSNISDIRIFTPNNATAGTQLRFINVINSINENVELSAGYEALEVNGGGKIYFNKFLITQTNRTVSTPTGYLLKILGDYGIPSDIHFTDLQITPNYLNQDYTAIVRSCDGLYFNNFHIHGGFLFSPSNVGNEKTLASVFFNNTYFDTANVNNILFQGSADNYRNFYFNNCYMRNGSNGLVFNTTSTLNFVSIIGGVISQQRARGISCVGDRLSDSVIIGTIFSGNNTNNTVSEGDIILNGQRNKVYGTSHSGGGANGNAINLSTLSMYNVIDNIDVQNSTATSKVKNNGSGNSLGRIIGQKTKNRGSATVASGTTSITVTHGVSVSITLENIMVMSRSSKSGGGDVSLANLTATTFDIVMQNAPTANVTFTWWVDATA